MYVHTYLHTYSVHSKMFKMLLRDKMQLDTDGTVHAFRPFPAFGCWSLWTVSTYLYLCVNGIKEIGSWP